MWQTKYPSTIKAEDVAAGRQVLEVPSLSRQTYSHSVAGEVARLNLFRKERKKYYRPKPPKPKPKPALPKVARVPTPPPPPPKPLAPPPQLILTGVVLLNGKQVAIFDGTYSEVRGGKVENGLKPRRRGYQVGETLGGYRIESIEKTHATLAEIAGSRLTLKVSKTSSMEKIRQSGTELIQKTKRVVPLAVPKRGKTLNPRPSPPISIRPNPGTPVPAPVPVPPGAAPPSSNPSFQNHPKPPLRQKSMGF